MLTVRKATIALLAMAFSLLAIFPVAAQDDVMGTPVMIMPVDRAQFLPGAFFDFRVEVHNDEMPADFAITINGTPAEEIGGEPTMESWELGDTMSHSAVWRDLTLTEPGEYTVEVTADGNTTSATWTVREPQDAGGKNVILFVADGGSVGTFTAARLLSRGIQQGTYNENLVFEDFEEFGLLSSSGVDSIITDSANSASAYNTGHKSSVNATGGYADTSEDAYDDPRVETFAEIVTRTRGMSVGIVTTAYMQDATPAAAFGHSRERNSRSRSDFMLQAIGDERSLGSPFVTVMPDVYLGGGARFILPNTVDGSARQDDIDVFALYEENGYTVATTNTELQAAVEAGGAILGVFASNNIDTWLDRNVYTDNLGMNTDQPGLVDMTVAALEVLSRNENGFYMTVEAASIDKQFHPMDFERGLADAIEFERSIAATMEWLEENDMLEETLVVVTADHGHSFDVYGTVDTVAFNEADDDSGRRNAIQIYSGAGFPSYEDADGDYYPDSWDVDITLAMGKVENPVFTENFQVSEVPRSPATRDENGNTINNPDDDPNGLQLGGNLPEGATSSVHTLQDVPVYAQGPASDMLGKRYENTEVFFAMAAAIGLDPRDTMGE